MKGFCSTLGSAPLEAWVGLVGVLFGSLLTILGVWHTNRANRAQLKLQLEHEERLQRQRLSKERLEELYVLVCHWLNAMFSNYMQLTLVMRGHSDYNQYLDSIISMKPSEGFDFNRLEMIIGIYGGQVKAAYDSVLEVRAKVNSIESSHKSSYRRGEDGGSFLKPFTDAQLELERACESLKERIASAARAA